MTTPANQHDALFRALVDDPTAASTLLRDHLPVEIAARVADTLPVLEDASFIDDELRATRGDRLYRVVLADGRPTSMSCLST
jgi:predicted transposase YdaD